MIDFVNLQKMIDEKYISVQQHPSLDLYIHNYTQRAQFDRMWNQETLQCRGLIMDSKRNIIARPFPKFFNLSEHIEKGGQIPAEDFIVTEKMDGSLGILYFVSGFPFLATRGSFVSDQAKMGTKILQSKYMKVRFNPHYTYLFEIIYPANRIVVDYGNIEDIFLLSVIHTQSGIEIPYEELKADFIHKVPIVKKHDAIKDFTKIEEHPNKEGYVITFLNGQRFKVKFDEYVRLHRLVTGVNAKTIWEMLRDEKPIDELLDRVPDEFNQWVRTTLRDLIAAYDEIKGRAFKAYIDADMNSEDRKEFALYTLKHYKDISSLIFAQKDNKPVDPIIWKMVRPKAEKPFAEEI
jgi:T4 RnlA family RNA ligase